MGPYLVMTTKDNSKQYVIFVAQISNVIYMPRAGPWSVVKLLCLLYPFYWRLQTLTLLNDILDPFYRPQYLYTCQNLFVIVISAMQEIFLNIGYGKL